jgi:pyrimidine operon attenuation protein/uracil phosphoribosyltransferase
MHFVVDKIVGKTGDGQWGQIHEFEKNGEKLVAVVSCHQAEASDVQILTSGREIISRVHELYFGNETVQPVLEKLRGVLQAIVEEFGQVQLAMVLIKKEIAYIGTFRAGVWLQMGEQEGWISEAETEVVRVFSGRLALGQTFVVGNHQFWKSVPFGTVKAVAMSGGSSEVMATLMHGQEGLQGAVVALVRMTEDAKLAMPNITTKPLDWLGDIKSKVAKFVPKPSGPIYVSYEDKQGRRQRTMWMGVGFLIVLAALVAGWQVRRTYTDQDRLTTLATIEQLQQQFSEGTALIALNTDRSREVLLEVKQGLASLENNKLAQKDDRVRTMAAQIDQKLAEASGISTLNPEVLLDLELVRNDMRGEKMEFADGDIMVLDMDDKRLVRIDPLKKNGSVVAGESQVGNARAMANYPTKLTLFSDRGIVECSVSKIECSVVVEPDSDWGSVSDMAMFGGNIYLLSDVGIWRHQVTSEGGYGSKQDWLADSEDSGLLSGATSMAIDGFVWVGLEGSISKYTRGVKDPFVISGLETPLQGKTHLYTTDETEKLYIHDSGNKRIVTLTKEGVYQKQYALGDISNLNDFLVDEKAGKLYILAGSKVLVTNL